MRVCAVDTISGTGVAKGFTLACVGRLGGVAEWYGDGWGGVRVVESRLLVPRRTCIWYLLFILYYH
jgi:hypothetical protein